MELLAYIQEESIYTDDAIANESIESTEAFQTWL
jgi:hypothetical protein